jgi:hypothetical protein
MMTVKFVQIVGNTVVNNLMLTRYPTLTLRFFAGKTGSKMRLMIADQGDPRQLTGRLYDLGETPELKTLRVKALAELLETRIDAEVKEFQRIRSGG